MLRLSKIKQKWVKNLTWNHFGPACHLDGVALARAGIELYRQDFPARKFLCAGDTFNLDMVVETDLPLDLGGYIEVIVYERCEDNGELYPRLRRTVILDCIMEDEPLAISA